MKKNNLITVLIILAIIILSMIILTNKKPPKNLSEETIKCIGEKATLYVQLGCPHCKDQENLFGEFIKHIKVVDCFYEKELCLKKRITAIPSWEINNQIDSGVKSIEKLKELTQC